MKSELGGQANEEIGNDLGMESFLMKGSVKISSKVGLLLGSSWSILEINFLAFS